MTTKITEKNISNLANAGVQWQSVVVADGSTGLTAVAGRGYFINTTSGAQTVTLPTSPTSGDTVVFKDYARTFATNSITIQPGSGEAFDGVTSVTKSFSTDGQTISCVYMDATKGWSLIIDDDVVAIGPTYISATGGTVTTSGNFKIHTFTGDGCFVVSTVGNPAGGGSNVDYLVVAGGGGGGGSSPGSSIPGGGGGAGGFRVSNSHGLPAPTTSPLANPVGITVTTTTYPITVGGGGAGKATVTSPPGGSAGNSGSPSIFSTITSAGGGGGGTRDYCESGLTGGSGGGSSGITCVSGAAGNTPPTSPPQGNSGGKGATSAPPLPGKQTGGGGGAGATGGDGNPGPSLGGIGSFVSPSFAGCNGTPGPVGSTKYFAGGGGVGNSPSAPTATAGGAGGGGSGGSAGTANTGGGGGGGAAPIGTSGAGGKGIVIIRYKFQ